MSFSRRSFSALALGALAAPGLARAAGSSERPALVELFTSQGCSSCPPADALMLRLADEQAIIPITFPVEIWDYLGWKDTLAKPRFTRRQRAYATAVANRRIYTPQAIVNGRAHCVGSDLGAITKLKSASAMPGTLGIAIDIGAQGWQASIEAGTMPPARLLLIPLSARSDVEIGRGENSGRSITYANVARDIIDLGAIEPGLRRLTVSREMIMAKSADCFALIAQAGTLDAPGIIHGAAFASMTRVKA